MSAIAKRLRLTALLGAGIAALVLAPAADAKTYKVDATTTGKTDANLHSVGTATSKALGKCKLAGDLRPPKYTAVWTCKKGKVKMVATTTSGNSDDVKSTVVITGGTGAYKGAKGKGIGTGKISTGVFHYVFSLKV